MSKLDEISVAIGELRNGVKEINRRMDENRELQTQRHLENQTGIGQLSAQVREQGDKLDQHAAAVDLMQPTVAALELSRSKIATWASIGISIVVVLGWMFEALIKWAIAWILETHWK
ncbi:MAG: hypothetical protein WB868_16305 [Xanthobacteraceae bacterium]